MGIKLCRVDDRLIHGQVSTSWIRSHDINVVVVVDDKIAKDKDQIAILRLTAPASVKVYSLGIDEFYEKHELGILDQYNVMLVFENVNAPLALIKKGFKMNLLNIAGVRFREGRKQIAKQLSLSDAEINEILEISKLGVKIEMRPLIADPSVNVIELIKGGN